MVNQNNFEKLKFEQCRSIIKLFEKTLIKYFKVKIKVIKNIKKKTNCNIYIKE